MQSRHPEGGRCATLDGGVRRVWRPAMSTASVLTRGLVRSLLLVDRRAGAYLFGLVFGFPDERRRGNFPNTPGRPGSRAADRADLQSGDAERRALATQVMTGGSTS